MLLVAALLLLLLLPMHLLRVAIYCGGCCSTCITCVTTLGPTLTTTFAPVLLLPVHHGCISSPTSEHEYRALVVALRHACLCLRDCLHILLVSIDAQLVVLLVIGNEKHLRGILP
jgi:hypothetical protein